MDDAAEVFQADFFGLATAQAGDGDDFVLLVLAGPGATEANFQGFGLLLDDAASLLDVASDDVAAVRNHRGVSNDAVFKNGHIRGATANIHQYDPGFFFFLAQHGVGTGERLQVDGVQVQIRTLHTARNVFDAGQLANHDVEGCFQTSAVHAARLLDVALAVHFVLLGQDVDDFFAGHHGELVHVFGQSVQICILNHLLRILAGDVVRMLQAANVLAGNAHRHRLDGETGTLFGQFHRLFNGLNGLGDVHHHAALNAQARRRTVADDFNFPKLIVASNQGHNFGGSDV